MLPYLLEYESENKSKSQSEILDILKAGDEDLIFEIEKNNNKLKSIFRAGATRLRTAPKDEESFSASSVIRGVVYSFLQNLNCDGHIEDLGKRDSSHYVRIQSSDPSILIGKNGRTLDTFQFLVNILVNKWTHTKNIVVLDVCGYRERRKDSIEKIVASTVAEVLRKNKELPLKLMSPYERRIVHTMLEDDSRVFTESEGKGLYKRVFIIPYPDDTKQGSGDEMDDEADNEIDDEMDNEIDGGEVGNEIDGEASDEMDGETDGDEIDGEVGSELSNEASDEADDEMGNEADGEVASETNDEIDDEASSEAGSEIDGEASTKDTSATLGST